MDQSQFEQKYGHIGRNHQQPKKQIKLKPTSQCCSKEKLAGGMKRIVPIVGWLPKYRLREYLSGDLITGLTVGIMVIPQGMAYATLAKVEPVYGLYSCFFAAFFYIFFGTSPHVSIGTFAVASMMTGNVVSEFIAEGNGMGNGTLLKGVNGTAAGKGAIHGDDGGAQITPIILTSALTFGVGICQLLMALCRLSFLTNYISDPLVSGFTTGAAIHVLASQIDKLIGVKIKGYHGPGLIIFMWRDLILAASKANLWTLGISAIGLIFLAVGRDYLNPWFRRRFHVPFPLELFLVIAAIVFSTLFGFKQNHGVRVVDHVPDGMPIPSLPRVELLPHLWLNAISISIISYIFVFSLSKIFAKRHKYKVDPNQELYAIGLCSFLSSFFPVYPFGASLSRSSLCEMTGAKTQLHALFSSALLLVVILWIGPLLEPLPMAILGCIVVISLKPLFLQFRELPRLWRISIYDFAIWLVAFTATALLDITYGLAISVLFSIFTVVLKEQWPNLDEMGEAKGHHHEQGAGIFRPINVYNGLIDPKAHHNVQIWRFESPLHFANAPKMVEMVGQICQQIAAAASPSQSMVIKVLSSKEFDGANGGKDAKKLHHSSNNNQSSKRRENGHGHHELGHQQNMEWTNNCYNCTSHRGASSSPINQPLLNATIGNEATTADGGGDHQEKTSNKEAGNGSSTPDQIPSNESSISSINRNVVGTLILDCSAISHIDAVGVDALGEIYKDGRKLNLELKFAGFSDALLSVFHRCAFFKDVPEHCFFPSIQEALDSVTIGKR